MSISIGVIHIPKTGGVSLFDAISRGGVERDGMRMHRHSTEFPKELLIQPLVSIVRNPFDRLYALYEFYSKQRSILKGVSTFKDFIYNLDEYYSRGRVRGSLNTNIFDSCSTYLIDTDEMLIPSDILRFEHLERDYNALCKKYDINASISHKNYNDKKNRLPRDEIYDHTMKSIVEVRYKDDIINFGYTYEQFITKI